MAKMIKKAQNGAKTKKMVSISEARKKVDSLDYDAKTRKQAAINRTTGTKGFDDISKKLIEQSKKSDSLKNVWQKNIDKAKSKKKMQAGGVVSKNKKAPMVDPKGAYTKVQERTIAGRKMAKKGMRISKKK